MTASLLPANATAQELALEGVVADRIEAIETDGIRTVNDPTACPAAVLPFLAWSKSVDVYLPGASETDKRRAIAVAPAVHRIKGTPQSVVDALAALGLAARVEERIGARLYDGATAYDGTALYGPEDGWALYRVILASPIRNDQVAAVRRLLETTAAKHCELVSLDYTEAANLYDGSALYDGTYNHGEAA